MSTKEKQTSAKKAAKKKPAKKVAKKAPKKVAAPISERTKEELQLFLKVKGLTNPDEGDKSAACIQYAKEHFSDAEFNNLYKNRNIGE